MFVGDTEGMYNGGVASRLQAVSFAQNTLAFQDGNGAGRGRGRAPRPRPDPRAMILAPALKAKSGKISAPSPQIPRTPSAPVGNLHTSQK